MKYILYSILTVVIVVIGLLVWRSFSNSGTSSTGGTTQNGGNPFGTPAGTVPGVTTGSSNAGATLTLTARDGSRVVVPDFTASSQPPSASAENGYQIAGSAASTFHILYFPRDSGILVSLYAEPLGQTRLAAESALKTALQLSDKQLCSLIVSVRTSSDVSPYYAGKELGLSFCLGATTLPK